MKNIRKSRKVSINKNNFSKRLLKGGVWLKKKQPVATANSAAETNLTTPPELSDQNKELQNLKKSKQGMMSRLGNKFSRTKNSIGMLGRAARATVGTKSYISEKEHTDSINAFYDKYQTIMEKQGDGSPAFILKQAEKGTKEEFKIPASEKLVFKASNKVKSILN